MSSVPSSNLSEILAKNIIAAVDSIPETNQAGIVLSTIDGQLIELRGGPRAKYLYIAPKFAEAKQAQSSQKQAGNQESPSNWDVWGDAALNCGSALFAGAAIGFSGGQASWIVGGLFVNSAAMCIVSVSKGIYYDEWQQFKTEGGSYYTAWLCVETALGLIDLCGGVTGAIGVIKSWERAGKLGQISKAIGKKTLTRKQILKAIQEIEPEFQPVMKGAGQAKKASLIVKGEMVLKNAKFVSLRREQASVICAAIADALTIAGGGSTIEGMFDLTLVVSDGSSP